jgi:hypothetical protein
MPLRHGVGDGDGEVSSSPLVDPLVSVDSFEPGDAPVFAGAILVLGRAPRDLILWIASSLRCLKARTSSILRSLPALMSVLSGGAKPGGMVEEG